MKTLKIKEPIQYDGAHVEAGTVIKGVDNALAAELVRDGKATEVKPVANKVDNRDPKDLEKRQDNKTPANKPKVDKSKAAEPDA